MWNCSLALISLSQLYIQTIFTMCFWRCRINVWNQGCALCPLKLLFCCIPVLCFILKPVRLQAPSWLVLHTKQHNTVQHMHTSARWAERRRPVLPLRADPALIQQTKLSLLNAQQKSSLSRHYAAVLSCSPSIHRPPGSPHIHDSQPMYTSHEVCTQNGLMLRLCSSCSCKERSLIYS